MGPNSEPYLINGPGNTLLATDPLKNAVILLDRTGKETRRWTTESRKRCRLRTRRGSR